ncbi:hypothetical protein ACHAXT_006003 [Thalassiosira profunda]
MDPPTSSSSQLKGIVHERQVHSPSTPKTTHASASHPSTASPRGGGTAGNTSPRLAMPLIPVEYAPPSSRPQSAAPLHRSRNAAKIIKGEIHNVLTVMRSDPRYYSTGEGKGKRAQSRFEYEERQQSTRGGRFWGGAPNSDWKADDAAMAGTISSHPVLQGLRDLHDLLSVLEVEGHSLGSGGSQTKSQLNAVTFVTPFAAAVRSGDVDARTTGEALSALHKFIVYGFIGRHEEEFSSYSMRLFSSSSEKVRESISVAAQCIRHCSFENRGKSSAASKGRLSFWPSSEKQTAGSNPILGESDSTVGASSDLPSFLTQPRRAHKSKGKGGGDSNANRPKLYASLSPSDEDVILKLLSLSVQVLRCPAGRSFLSSKDVVGVFDTCLHVAIAAGEANRSLLRSAAADALSHCVIVVFGMRGRSWRRHEGDQYGANNSLNDDTHDRTQDDASDSDDDWGERDPTQDDPLAANLKGPEKQDSQEEATEGDANVSEQVPSVNTESHEEEPALVAIMHRLATLADPLLHEDDTCVLALSLVNIALETMSDVDALSVRYPKLLSTMQNDLCRNLLRLSTSTDLAILGLSLRVIFNLFNSIKDHLKVQLEVFLTSVHLRILSFSIHPTSKERVWSSSPERRELALESLLEFCREPSLMADLYLNYDCDLSATNLFETICATLAKVANPEDDRASQSDEVADSEGEPDVDSSFDIDAPKPPRLNILNRLALEGVLAVIDGIARRCRASSNYKEALPSDIPLNERDDSVLPSPPDSGNSAFLGNTLYITNDGSGSTHDSAEYDFCNRSLSSAVSDLNRRAAPERCDSDMSELDIDWLSKARHHTSLALRERKLRKRRMAKAVSEFNERSRDREWIEEAERLGVLPTPATPASVASFLYSGAGLDKSKIGLYLSKGPKDKYPFHNEVLENFAALFEFSGLSFSDALRTFLGRFRLPGEAQCIDRLMEAFATRLYDVQLMGSGLDSTDQSVERSMLDPPRPDGPDGENQPGTLDPPSTDLATPVFPFKSSDAAFILSFSTIMLNTDLHNPNMKDEKRMTLGQFVRNNRGINDGADLPLEFLTDLYHEIKSNEIQVKSDLLRDGVGGAEALAFEGLLAKANDAATPFFTSNHPLQDKFVQAGVHERDMFVSISAASINAISTVFVESWDDVLVNKAVDGLQNAAYVCCYFGLNEQFNEILESLFGFGLDYVGSVTALMQPVVGGSSAMQTKSIGQDPEEAVSALEADLAARNIPPLPKSFLAGLNKGRESKQTGHLEANDVAGSAAHRGLLSLSAALTLSKRHLSNVSEALPTLLDVIFALRDVSALPSRLLDLDDFADSQGNPLPVSVFANRSQQRVNEYMQSITPSEEPGSAGFLSSIFGFGQSPIPQNGQAHAGTTEQLFPLSETLQQVANDAQLDQIIMKTSDVAMAKRILSAMLGSMFPEEEEEEEMASDPLLEHNSCFVLELAARLLISNRAHAAELYPLFLTKFQQLLRPRPEGTDGSDAVVGLRFPYILERIVVTILRACIHLFDLPELALRDQLRRSLDLIAALPSSYTHAISDRIGCGAGIILRGCFYLFGDRQDDWTTIKSLLDLAAQDKSGRGFVFDGIASVIDSIDYAIPSTHDGDENGNDIQLSQCGVEVMASLLLKFMNGSYEEDLSFKVVSMTYIKKVYSYSQHFSDSVLSSDDGSAKNNHHLQENEFETMINAIYHDACLSDDVITARRGFDSLQGIVLSTRVDSLPVKKWFAFLRLVSTSPPGIANEEARISHLILIGRLFLSLMPELSNTRDNWSELEDWTICVASIVSENLQAGRATSLFETTVQTATNVVNVVSMSGFNDGEGLNFCSWVGETLLYELEKVGASGGCSVGDGSTSSK